jgi:hypothetical protein
MPTFVTFYAYAFEGAPLATTRGWFAAPGITHLLATRARTALGRATGEHVTIYRCRGAIEREVVHCDGADVLFEGPSDENLWWFTLYCARSVVTKWPAPDLVREYLRTGSPALRQVAHRCAWASSLELEGTANLAARVTMYASSEERAAFATREACRLAGQVAGDKLTAAAIHQERALASALLGSISQPQRSSEVTLGVVPDSRPTPRWGREFAA